MFAYNQLSDLKDGTLVTPISKKGSLIECLLQDGITTANYSFSDFDFKKTIEEREIYIDSSYEDSSYDNSTDLSEEQLTVNLTPFNITIDLSNIIVSTNQLKDKFEWIETKDKLIFRETIII